MTKELIQTMLAEGKNLNQIASIYMVSRVDLEKILAEKPIEKKPKNVENLQTGSGHVQASL